MSGPSFQRRTQANWPFVRDVLLFLGGLGGVIHETVVKDVDRPTLLLTFAAMMGLPAFFPTAHGKKEGD